MTNVPVYLCWCQIPARIVITAMVTRVWSRVQSSSPRAARIMVKPAVTSSSNGESRTMAREARERVRETRRSTTAMGTATIRLRVDSVNPLAASHRLGCFSASQNTPDIVNTDSGISEKMNSAIFDVNTRSWNSARIVYL